MPMLHSCSFPGCHTRTLSTYCVEHEIVVRAKKLAERIEGVEAREQPLAAELAEIAGPDLSAA